MLRAILWENVAGGEDDDEDNDDGGDDDGDGEDDGDDEDDDEELESGELESEEPFVSRVSIKSGG